VGDEGTGGEVKRPILAGLKWLAVAVAERIVKKWGGK
jgi:hypothetical protein